MGTAVQYIYLAAAASFVIGLHLMNNPATARRGNLLSGGAMAVAVAATVALLISWGTVSTTAWLVIAAGAATGSTAGVYAARRVHLTAMPQLVSLFNAVGGGAAALIAIAHLLSETDPGARFTVPGALDILIGAVAFSGSLVAAGKLQGWVPAHPIVYRGARLLPVVLAAGVLAGVLWLVAAPESLGALLLLTAAALGFGVVMVLPIGGADMPVVISLLNAAAGLAVSLAGFVLDELVLVIAGALVGAAGSILTKLMAEAMNRSVLHIMLGGFGTGDGGGAAAGSEAQVRSVTVEDVAIQLAYADRVVIVPGYGLAAAQAQHQAAALAALLEERGVTVTYAIHPVAGRMPGHMNVLLAEANVPYPQLRDLEQANPEFPQADVALVVGANDVTNPAARRPGTAISGMPILDVDRARSIVVIKRSMGHGYAGIDNELYTDPRTGMLFADAKQALTDLAAAVRTFVR
ncbi:MAG TPA: NAD(P)(+) transhydrogenase (Re/Si-specific) subunit beta [Natronosporangium sp.]|nr:NAD(P)(+) transhydrogenase (Re/Si-specific) subunit beta [Natronosporangium sp.]